MSNSDSTNNASLEDYQRAYEMQKKAREHAEKLLEDKSRELYLKNQSLEQALDKLSHQQTQLVSQEKLASIGQLGAGLAHELNNPNAFIQNNLITLNEYVQLLISGMDDALNLMDELKRDIKPPDKQTNVEYKISQIKHKADLDFIRNDRQAIIEESLNGSKRIKNIANGLLYFANPDISTRKTIDVNKCIRQSLQLLPIEQDQLKPIDIVLELGELPEVTGTPILISQAIANVIQNAVESAPKSLQVFIRSSCVKDAILITVQDDGEGISQDNLTKVFQPFFTQKLKHNGLGLGISQSIITQHQGTIHINSSKDHDTVVTIKLPLNTGQKRTHYGSNIIS
jgi:signal transduction histidine kinase